MRSVFLCLTIACIACAGFRAAGAEPYAIRKERLRVPMRDGVELAAEGG